MTSTFECGICCSEFPLPNPCSKKTRRTVLPCTCPKCAYTTCNMCQTRFGKGECAKCAFEFSRFFIMENLGPNFHKEVIVPNITKELMVEQRVNLETVDVKSTVEWMNACQEIRRNSRFGCAQQMPPKPPQTGHTFSTKYLCSNGDCRGIVIGTKCTACGCESCVYCHEVIIKEKAHVCNEDAKMAVSESKACPKCYAPIFKMHGCDDMHCTACNTKFSWNTMQINKRNSNHHYPINQIFGLRNNGTVQENEDYCTTSTRFDLIPRDAIDRYIASSENAISNAPSLSKLLDFLYTVTNSVRENKVRLFDEIKLTEDWHTRTHDLRVQYLLKKITERGWEQRVYALYVQYKAHLLHAAIVNLYLSTTDGFQVEVRDILQNQDPDAEKKFDDILNRLDRLTVLCNESFAELHKDYPIDASQLYIRNTNDHDIEYDCGFYLDKADNHEKTCSINPDAQSIELFDYQRGHVRELDSIIRHSYYAIDLSMLGAGKTFTAMYLYKAREYAHGLIVAPASVVGKWKELVFTYGLIGVEVYSFNELGGSMGKNQRVGHLIRRVDKLSPQGNVVSYRTTALLKKYVRNGLFLIIDEIQNIKNHNSAQTKACKELVCLIKEEYDSSKSTSRALLISGSPLDKAEQSVQFFKTIGVMTSHELTKFDIGEFARSRGNNTELIKTGMHEIRTYCESINVLTTEGIVSKNYNTQIECYRLFVDVIKPHVSRAMVVVGGSAVVRKYNGMFNLYASSAKSLLTRGIKLLSKCIQRRDESREHARNHQEFVAALQKALLLIETAKIPIMIQQIRKKLTEDPMCKVVLACNYTQTIRDVVRELGCYCPLVLDGSIPTNRRQSIIRSFQEPNADRRLLIGNLHVLSSGIDLDDKDGSFPRVCYISPNYHTIDLYQMSYRFLRSVDTRSDTELYMIYVKKHTEQNMLSSISAKGKIMKEVVEEQSRLANILFPCDFTDYVEPEPIDLDKLTAEYDAIFTRIQSQGIVQ